MQAQNWTGRQGLFPVEIYLVSNDCHSDGEEGPNKFENSNDMVRKMRYLVYSQAFKKCI